MHQQQQSTSGLRENVSNASPAYKVLYMETPLCSCGRINASNGRASKLGKKQTQRHWKSSKRGAITARRTTGHTVVIDVWDRVPGAADLDWPTETMDSILQDRPTATFSARLFTWEKGGWLTFIYVDVCRERLHFLEFEDVCFMYSTSFVILLFFVSFYWWGWSVGVPNPSGNHIGKL